MTSIPVVLSEQIHLNALRRARAIGSETEMPPGVLYAPLDDDTRGWIDRIWDSMEEALKRAYREGIAVARPYMDAAAALVTKMTTEFSRRAEEVRATISARLDEYIRDMIDAALRRIRATLSVGGRDFRMKSVKVEQHITVSGSLKASLEQLCEFVAEGELSLAAEYTTES